MEFRTTATLIAAILCSSTSLAATYQNEGMGTYNAIEDDSAYGLRAIGHFASVSTEGRPLQEAAFLERAGNFTLSYTAIDVGLVDSDLLRADLNYYVPNSMFFLGGHVLRTTSAGWNGSSSSENDWGVTLGLTPADGLLIYTKYRSAPSLSGSTLGQILSALTTFEDEDYQPNFSAKYVTALDGGRAWKIETTYINSDFLDYFYLGSDYFFDPTFSLGLWMEDYDVSDNGYGIRTEKFFTHQISLRASYLDSDDSGEWQVGVRFRF